MRILVISDVHSNLTALEAVIAAAKPYDAVWCLGDLVGYGPDPNECIELISSQPQLTCLLGNHDAAVGGSRNIEKFNSEAREAILFTKEVITPANNEFLKALPETIENEYATLVHGSIRNPIWEYLVDPYTAFINFAHFSTNIAMVGHTHLPVYFQIDDEQKDITRGFLKSGEKIDLNVRSIVNPGSTGQPRDHDPRASFGIFDTDAMTWENQRVEYDIQSVQDRIMSLNLPEKGSLRLSKGW